MTRPLSGLRIVVTRPRPQAPALCALLAERGAVPLTFPTIAIVPPADPIPLETALQRLETYDWIVFTSVNGVEAFFERVPTLPGMVRVAAIGPATASALTEHGVTGVTVPGQYVAERIADELGDVTGRRVLMPRAALARRELADLLRRGGATVDDVSAYDTAVGTPTAKEIQAVERGVDVVTFTSSSTVRHFLDLAPAPSSWRDAVIACIGPITESTARDLDLPVRVVAETYTTAGLVESLATFFSQPETAST